MDERLPWQEAQTACRNEGGDLASVHDPETNRFIHTLITKSALLGGYKENDVWGWSDGSNYDYTRWKPWLDKTKPDAKMILIFGGNYNGLWGYTDSSMDYGFICQFNPTCKIFLAWQILISSNI